MRRIIVVGGGASGMMAAGRAAECGGQVTLLEKTARLGNKLKILLERGDVISLIWLN